MEKADLDRLLRFWRGVHADQALLSPSTAELVKQTINALEQMRRDKLWIHQKR